MIFGLESVFTEPTDAPVGDEAPPAEAPPDEASPDLPLEA